MTRLAGKVAVITGAGSGIGAAAADLFHKEGAKVVAVDISGQQDDVAARIGDGCVPVQADVSKGDEVKAVVDSTMSTFGRIDVLYHNAGIWGEGAPIHESTEENFERVMAVNARGTYLALRHTIPAMLEAGGGSIVITASAAGMVAVPTAAAYCASKGAILMLTKTVAAEYAGAGIRVNAICPGTVNTPMATETATDEALEMAKQMTPLARLAEPGEIAQMALYLASDESSFVTGAAMLIDGGYTVL